MGWAVYAEINSICHIISSAWQGAVHNNVFSTLVTWYHTFDDIYIHADYFEAYPYDMHYLFFYGFNITGAGLYGCGIGDQKGAEEGYDTGFAEWLVLLQ